MTTHFTKSLFLMLFVFMFFCATSISAFAFGDYPHASCKSWDGTIVEISGLNSARASMVGKITEQDVKEFCLRQPPDPTTKSGKRQVKQCIKDTLMETSGLILRTLANCRDGSITFSVGSWKKSARFPLSQDEGTGCASNLPPVIEQFRILCPNRAIEWGIERY
jgi:hypothetical protein